MHLDYPKDQASAGYEMELEEVEFANEAFYLAFEGKDYDAMAHLWSHEREIVCLHPGWPALIGRDEV